MDGFAKSLPESGHELSLRGRRRVADLGLHIRASLAYSETPPREFLRLLAIAARHRHAFEDEPERNRALDTRHSGGGFYDLGCGIGSLCLLAAIYHDFAGVVGVELLPELYEQGCLLMEDYYNYHMQARLVRKEPPAVVRFELGDFLTCHMVEPVPAVIFCHCVCFDQVMMEKMALKLRFIPVSTVVITTGIPMPVTAIKSGSRITFEILDKVHLAMPFGSLSAFVQRRELSQSERDEIERNSDIDSSPSSSSVVSQS